MDEASAELAASHAGLHAAHAAENGSTPAAAASAGEAEDDFPVTRVSFSGTTTTEPKRVLSGRKWSSRRMGLSRKDSLEYDASRVKGVTITHASYGVSVLLAIATYIIASWSITTGRPSISSCS